MCMNTFLLLLPLSVSPTVQVIRVSLLPVKRSQKLDTAVNYTSSTHYRSQIMDRFCLYSLSIEHTRSLAYVNKLFDSV